MQIETALVSSSGRLLIELSDGSIVDAGYVKGGQGPAGRDGADGAPGIPGAKGDAGTNGAMWHTGVGAPELLLGVNGDLYLDVASAMLPIYQKVNGSWLFLANLKATPVGSGGGGGNGVSQGEVERPIIISPDYGTPNNPGTPPNFHPNFSGPDANLEDGDLWIDGNGVLYFYFNSQWNKLSVYTDTVLPADDAPFVITTPNGEVFDNQQQYNEWLYTRTDRRPILSTTPPAIHPDFPAYPLRAGDYWIDDNNRLYFWDGVAWLPIEGNAGRAPIFAPTEPTEHPDYVAPDNQLEVGDIWYDTDDNFKQYIWDGSLWVAITPARKEAFTRFYEAVDPATYNSGNDGTCVLAGAATINAITNVKLSGNDSQGKVRYLYKVNEDILIEDERNGAYAVLRVTAINVPGDYDVELEHYNGVGNIDFGQIYAFGSAADRGAIPDVGDDLHQPGTLDDRYVNVKGGDTMQGPLRVSGQRDANTAGIESTIEALNIDSGQNSALHLKHNGSTQVYVGSTQTSFQGDIKFNVSGRAIYAQGPDKKGFVIDNGGVFYDGAYTADKHVATKKDVEEAIYHDILDPDTNKYVDRTGDSMTGPLIFEDTKIRFNASTLSTDYIDFQRPSGEYITAINFAHNNDVPSAEGGYEINLAGFSSYNRLRLTGRNSNSEPLMFEARADGAMGFHKNVSLNDSKITNLGEAVDDTDATNKQYVDDRDELLRQDIIELEQEINSIAPSLEYGSWKFGIPANPGRPPSTGTFYLLDNGTYTDDYGKVTGIAIHNDEYVAPGDLDPVDNHTWADADVGELIQLFDSADPDFFLGKITAKNVDVPGQCVYLTVDRIQSSGVPNDNADPVTGEFLTRVNIFKEPSGGNASEFVQKIGDTMTGNLVIDKSEGSTDIEAVLILKGNRPDTTNSAATITFDNKNSADKGYLTYRASGGDSWFRFNQDVDLNNNGLHSVSQIRMQSNGYIGAGSASRIQIRTGTNSDAGTEIQRVADNKRTFAIKGKANNSTTITDFFYAYGNSNGDAINYSGIITAANHITNKAYVDDRVRVDISTSSSNRVTGDMWYNPNDGVLYLKVS